MIYIKTNITMQTYKMEINHVDVDTCGILKYEQTDWLELQVNVLLIVQLRLAENVTSSKIITFYLQLTTVWFIDIYYSWSEYQRQLASSIQIVGINFHPPDQAKIPYDNGCYCTAAIHLHEICNPINWSTK